jgi:hypothetical protein
MRSLGAFAGTLALCCATSAAHDFWIEPTTFSPEPGRIVGARLRVGQELLGDPVPRDPALVNQFIMVDNSGGRKQLIGRGGSDPAGLLRVEAPGLLVIGYLSNPSPVEMPAEKFNQYLKDEGLDAAAALRAQRGQSGSTAHEIFSRCAKSLVLSGPATRAQSDQPLGFTLELVAERNPYAIRGGEELPLRLTYQGRPLARALVVAINKLNPADKLSARTDSEGRVRFRLGERGMWMVKAVHMIAAPEGSHAEWASYWASLTFELPGASTASR